MPDDQPQTELAPDGLPICSFDQLSELCQCQANQPFSVISESHRWVCLKAESLEQGYFEGSTWLFKTRIDSKWPDRIFPVSSTRKDGELEGSIDHDSVADPRIQRPFGASLQEHPDGTCAPRACVVACTSGRLQRHVAWRRGLYCSHSQCHTDRTDPRNGRHTVH